MRTAIALGLAAGILLAGCDSATQDSAAPVPTLAPTTTAAARPTATTPKATPKPRPTTPAVTVDGPCPYADRGTVMDIIGQHLLRTTVTSTTPHPGCAFYRPNGERAAEIAVSVLPTATAAQAKAIALPGKGANPVQTVADGGTVAITAGGAVLAVSKGRALVVVRINQRISLEAIEIAKLVAAKI
ncbi:MAG TPA: DUF2020 domain-containing protein [Mycobacteriales bacterium]|nr:DUF2020 domain-containing protein [Mycobacteriales bacterium]